MQLSKIQFVMSFNAVLHVIYLAMCLIWAFCDVKE